MDTWAGCNNAGIRYYVTHSVPQQVEGRQTDDVCIEDRERKHNVQLGHGWYLPSSLKNIQFNIITNLSKATQLLIACACCIISNLLLAA